MKRPAGSPAPLILVVDDHPFVRTALANECRELGCTVRTAGNGEEALDVLTDFAADIIVLDLHMPVMDGPEFVRCLRQRPCARAAILLLSSEIDLASIARAIGADAWVTKTDPDAFRKAFVALKDRVSPRRDANPRQPVPKSQPSPKFVLSALRELAEP